MTILKLADAIKLFRVIEGMHNQGVFQSDLDRLVEWSENRQVKLNLKKYKIVHADKVNSKTMCEMDGQKLDKIEMEKDQGIIINSKLSASNQVLRARKRAPEMLGAIFKYVSYKIEEVKGNFTAHMSDQSWNTAGKLGPQLSIKTAGCWKRFKREQQK